MVSRLETPLNALQKSFDSKLRSVSLTVSICLTISCKDFNCRCGGGGKGVPGDGSRGVGGGD